MTVSNIVHAVRHILDCRRLRLQSQWRGNACARKCLADARWLSAFQGEAAPGNAAYADLFRYFVAGFVTYRSPLGAHADYVGLRSYNGPAMDRLEGFSRVAPLLAAWIQGGRPGRVDFGTKSIDALDLLRAGVLAGTNPASPEYWGKITHWSQAVVEAADIALALWLSRSQLWDQLTDAERVRIADWLQQVNHKRIPDNNWHLFVVQVNAVLASLGAAHNADELQRHYQQAKSFHAGGGWFRDGRRSDTPGFDYYNAWGFHYHLRWIRQIAPELDPGFMDTAFRDFVATYRYLLGPSGFPILGRSACYRMAAAAPLIQAQPDHADLVSPGEARHALDTIWQYFVRRGALADGNVSQGYLAADSRLLENYSGPASCLWSLRSLIPAFALPDQAPLWQAQPMPSPVERGNYQIRIVAPGWTVIGDQARLNISLTTGETGSPALNMPSRSDRIKEAFTCKPRRADNVAAKYHRARYDSSAPFGIVGTQSDGLSGHPLPASKP